MRTRLPATPTLRGAGPLFERVLAELRVQPLDAAEARNIVAADIGRAIVDRTVRPRDGLSEIEVPEEADDGFGDLWPADDPWRFYDDGWPEDPKENAARHAEVDASVVEAARKMLARLALEAGRQ